MKKAVIYLRVSTLDQEYERQEYELREFAKNRGYEIINVFEEKKSAVLDMDTREELTKMRQLTKNEIECIFVWDITRLSRKATDFIALVNEFAEKGICIHFKDKDIKTLDDDGKMNAMASIYLYMLGVFAQMDAENLKAKFKSGKENALRKGHSYTNIAPFGYYLEDKHLHVKEEEAMNVRFAFELYNEGKDLQYIADIFNAKQIPLKSGKTNIIWVKGTIYQILKNTVYYGKGKLENITNIATGEKTVRYFDAPIIVDKGLFDLVQERFALNKSINDKGRLEPSLLRGLLFCGLCKKPYVFANNNKKRIYRDSDMRANINQRIGCKNGQLNVEKGDEAVWNSLKHIYEYEQYIKKTAEEKERCTQQIIINNKSIEQIKTQLSNYDKEKSRVSNAYVKGLFSEDELYEHKSRIEADESRQNKIINDLLVQNTNLERQITTEHNPATFESQNLSMEEKKLICNELIESILIFTDGPLVKLLHVELKNGFVYNIGFYSKKDYFVLINETDDIKFDITKKIGVIKYLINPNAFSFETETKEYEIKSFIDAFDTAENRMYINLENK